MMNAEKRIEAIVDLMRRDDSVDAPADSVKWAKNLFRSRIEEPGKSLIQRIFAVLQMDLTPDQAAFGERSAAAGQARQMLFEAGEYAVDLRIKGLKKGFEIRGQVLGAGFEQAGLVLANDATVFETTADGPGEFRFEAVPGGEYSLTISGGEGEIVVERLNVSD